MPFSTIKLKQKRPFPKEHTHTHTKQPNQSKRFDHTFRINRVLGDTSTVTVHLITT